MTSIQRVVSIGAHSLDAELMGGPLISNMPGKAPPLIHASLRGGWRIRPQRKKRNRLT